MQLISKLTGTNILEIKLNLTRFNPTNVMWLVLWTVNKEIDYSAAFSKLGYNEYTDRLDYTVIGLASYTHKLRLKIMSLTLL